MGTVMQSLITIRLDISRCTYRISVSDAVPGNLLRPYKRHPPPTEIAPLLPLEALYDLFSNFFTTSLVWGRSVLIYSFISLPLPFEFVHSQRKYVYAHRADQLYTQHVSAC